MKRLYLRLFERADNNIPTDSIQLNATNTSSDMDVADQVFNQMDVIGDWMVKHPEGKTDFVWLT